MAGACRRRRVLPPLRRRLRWLLAARLVRVPYGIALQAEMASMLAKYIPGGIWTPLARIVWLRRAGGVSDTSFVISSILLEAGPWPSPASSSSPRPGCGRRCRSAPRPPIRLWAVVVILLHPRVFTAIARVIFRRFPARPSCRCFRTGSSSACSATTCSPGWSAGRLYLLLRSLDADPGVETIPYLGGTAAVG